MFRASLGGMDGNILLMDIRKIKKLIDMIEQSSISEIEIVEGEEKIRISRPTAGQTVYAPATPVVSSHKELLIQSHDNNAAPVTIEQEHEPEGDYVRSPMVGTFYKAPSPGAKSFVEIGDKVTAGKDVLCIIEAMKMLNHIESDKTGVVRAILVEDGEPVEYDQPLLIIEPNP